MHVDMPGSIREHSVAREAQVGSIITKSVVAYQDRVSSHQDEVTSELLAMGNRVCGMRGG
jgi:hypothetical protein